MSRRFLLALVPLALGACATVPTPAEPIQAQVAPAESRGAVSAADPRAAEAGAAMLRQGGSATDAAIATMLALTVVEPQSSGIGGGGFLLHHSADGTIETLDGRETAPAAATPEWFLAEDGRPRPFMEAVLSGLSVGVPGNVRLAAEAHERHGKLPWADLFAPAIALARDGFVVTAMVLFARRVPDLPVLARLLFAPAGGALITERDRYMAARLRRWRGCLWHGSYLPDHIVVEFSLEGRCRRLGIFQDTAAALVLLGDEIRLIRRLFAAVLCQGDFDGGRALNLAHKAEAHADDQHDMDARREEDGKAEPFPGDFQVICHVRVRL